MLLLKTGTSPLLRSPLQNYLKLPHHPLPLPFKHSVSKFNANWIHCDQKLEISQNPIPRKKITPQVLLKRKSSEISPEERSTWHGEEFRAPSPKRTIFFNPDRDSYQKIKVIKPTNSFTPPSDLTKENRDIPAPPNGMKFNLWPSAIYPVEPDVEIEDVKKGFFLKKPIQVVSVWASTDKAYADVLQCLRQYVLDMVIDFNVDWEIGQLGEKEAVEPNLDLNMKNESPGNILKKPHRGVVFSSKGRLKFMRISQKHLFSSEFIQGIISLLKRIGDQDESLRVKIIEELTWFLSF
ncbi:unnamed protein product [Lactuca virosa]|uniref:Uncharacterized protein n=1 Tax=Lactuca virosa TaxID=75947 RepID=A0AAU9PAR0_9ASTR|nr:unnamed protein product [Lactuca virosa]